jgi:hypothetical protein
MISGLNIESIGYIVHVGSEIFVATDSGNLSEKNRGIFSSRERFMFLVYNSFCVTSYGSKQLTSINS